MDARIEALNPKDRFSDRAENYLRYRPHYPHEIIPYLKAEAHLSRSDTIADIGSGTGFLAELFLENGNLVFGVEPNAEMRTAGDRYLEKAQNFITVKGSAEHTNLPDQCIEAITVGQAFHWFDVNVGCTSEDINNVAYALMMKATRDEVMLPMLLNLTQNLRDLAHRFAAIPLLARTHGQPASPTTVGKEFANVVARLTKQIKAYENEDIFAKFNGAVGNFNAHVIAYPDVDWPALSEAFIADLALSYNDYTTQIEPHDGIAEMLHTLSRINTILIDFCRDIWGYISLGHFKQQLVEGEIGSSTMPHKINPINLKRARAT